MSFQVGDLLECVANDVSNPDWGGIPPVIGDYYTWRGNDPFTNLCGWVEELRAPVSLSHSMEPVHLKRWYRKVEDNIDIKNIVEESLTSTLCTQI